MFHKSRNDGWRRARRRCTAGGILLRPEARAHAGLPSTDEVGCRRANRYTSNGEEPAMKIARVKIYLIAGGKLHPVIVEIVTDEGVSGIGEAAIAYGLGGTAAAGMVKDLSERMLIGRDPFRIEEIWSEMYDHSFWAKGADRSCSPPSARSSRRCGTSRVRRSASRSTNFSVAGCATACMYTRTAGTARLRRPPSLPRRRNARCATGTMR